MPHPSGFHARTLLHQWFSKRGPWARGISLTLKFVRNASSLPHPRPLKSDSGSSTQKSVFKSPQVFLMPTHHCFRSNIQNKTIVQVSQRDRPDGARLQEPQHSPMESSPCLQDTGPPPCPGNFFLGDCFSSPKNFPGWSLDGDCDHKGATGTPWGFLPWPWTNQPQTARGGGGGCPSPCQPCWPGSHSTS